MLDVYKAKMPIKQDSNYYYPITTFDQIILPDGTRWDGTMGDKSSNDFTDEYKAKLDEIPTKKLATEEFVSETLNELRQEILGGEW